MSKKIKQTKPTYNELVSLLDDWRMLYWNNDVKVYDNDENYKNANEYQDVLDKTCRVLVDNGNYKEDDLFWSEARLARIEEESKELLDFMLNDPIK